RKIALIVRIHAGYCGALLDELEYIVQGRLHVGLANVGDDEETHVICDFRFASCDWKRKPISLRSAELQIANCKSQIKKTRRRGRRPGDRIRRASLLRAASFRT